MARALARALTKVTARMAKAKAKSLGRALTKVTARMAKAKGRHGRRKRQFVGHVGNKLEEAHAGTRWNTQL